MSFVHEKKLIVTCFQLNICIHQNHCSELRSKFFVRKSVLDLRSCLQNFARCTWRFC